MRAREAGDDRAETRALATAARDAYRNLPEHGTQVGEINAWLAEKSKGCSPGRLTGRGTVAAGQRRSFWASLGSRHREDGRGALVSGERTPEQGTLCLIVRDTGLGMDDATRARIFEPDGPQLALGTDDGVSFLQKPIMPPQLLSMLRNVLDQPS